MIDGDRVREWAAVAFYAVFVVGAFLLVVGPIIFIAVENRNFLDRAHRAAREPVIVDYTTTSDGSRVYQLPSGRAVILCPPSDDPCRLVPPITEAP